MLLNDRQRTYTYTFTQFSWKKSGGVWFGVAEASSLGWKPGEWPVSFVVEGIRENLLFVDETLPHPHAVATANETGHHYTAHRANVNIHVLND